MNLTEIIFHPNLFLIFEFLAFLAYAIILIREIYQKNSTRIFEIFSATIFGMLLEISNIYVAHTYHYSSNFLVNVFNVPLAIGCGWAIIIYSAMLLSDQYRIPWHLRPYIDALSALLLDLSMDAVAIRLGFWSWAIPLDQEWYGVPYENLFGWIIVVLSFSFLVRFIRTLNSKRLLTKIIKLISPFIAYIGLFIALALFGFLTTFPYFINNWGAWMSFNFAPDVKIIYDPQVQIWKLIFLTITIVELVNVSAWSLIKYRQKFLRFFDILSFTALSTIHLFFIIVLFTSKLVYEMPVLLFLGVITFSAHCLLHFLPYLMRPKRIYFFKRISLKIKNKKEQIQQIINYSMK